MANNLLGSELKKLRESKGDSLRQVEKQTGVSNAYLSQLESGKVTKPAPNILHKLSEHYGTSYKKLMELAGYLNRQNSSESETHSLTSLQVELLREGEDLTADEVKAVAAFIRYVRAERKQNSDK